MADVDEDEMPLAGPEAGEVDLSDETQDFRFLASVSAEDAKIPKRGEKEFEPHHTALQSNTLAASRAAMHTALSFQRVHTAAKRYSLAVYHPETNMAYSESPKGPLFKNMGRTLSRKDDPLNLMLPGMNRLWLLPEEVLYLLERGTIDVRWPAGKGEDDDSGLPMSLQGGYSTFIGMEAELGGALTFERYSVYSALKRMGYIVHRAPSWSSDGYTPGSECFPPIPGTAWGLGLLKHQWRRLFAGNERQVADRDGPMVSSRLYRSYSDVYRRLALVPWYDPTQRVAGSQSLLDPAFRITYHVWKPSNTVYKKSEPGPPDFRIAVVNARDTTVPTLAQLSALLDTTPYQPPEEGAQLYQKLRHGYKNVILAIVDQGVTSYLRLTDAGFGKEKLYERRAKPSKGKRGGGKGGNKRR